MRNTRPWSTHRTLLACAVFCASCNASRSHSEPEPETEDSVADAAQPTGDPKAEPSGGTADAATTTHHHVTDGAAPPAGDAALPDSLSSESRFRSDAAPSTSGGSAEGGGRTDSSTSRSDAGIVRCLTMVDASLTEHACFHIAYGPFVSVVASANDGASVPATVTSTHTTYEVTLRSESEPGVVGLQVSRTGLYAIFSDLVARNDDRATGGAEADDAIPLALHDGTNEVQARSTHRVASCSGLSAVGLYPLETQRSYALHLGPGAAHVRLVLEQTDPSVLREVCPTENTAGSSNDTSSPDPSATSSESGGPASNASPSGDLGSSHSGSDAGEPDSAPRWTSSDDTSTSPSACAPLKASCLSGSECCSGRCYARECVVLECRTAGYCERDEECCSYCHVTDSPHCH